MDIRRSVSCGYKIGKKSSSTIGMAHNSGRVDLSNTQNTNAFVLPRSAPNHLKRTLDEDEDEEEL
ncbi:hypothetical protein HDU76_012634 [Blyttiomyces sp. JEL0837]|nr:hypothetical protein HDU76_012634 [Blyttiomyces sp. JEL0837]